MVSVQNVAETIPEVDSGESTEVQDALSASNRPNTRIRAGKPLGKIVGTLFDLFKGE